MRRRQSKARMEGRKVIDKHINHLILNLFTGEAFFLMERFFPSQYFWQLITLPHANVKNHFKGLTKCAQNFIHSHLFSKKITFLSRFIGTS
jgi:hypothetical protein